MTALIRPLKSRLDVVGTGTGSVQLISWRKGDENGQITMAVGDAEVADMTC